MVEHIWQVRCMIAQKLHVRNYLNKLQSPHLCLSFLRDEIQQVLRLYGYVNRDNWYFHKQAHQEGNISYLEEDQMLKSQTSGPWGWSCSKAAACTTTRRFCSLSRNQRISIITDRIQFQIFILFPGKSWRNQAEYSQLPRPKRLC